MTRTEKRAGRVYLAALIGGVVGGVLGVMSVLLLFETWGAQSTGASVIAGLLAYPLIGFGIAGGITAALTLRKHSDGEAQRDHGATGHAFVDVRRARLGPSSLRRSVPSWSSDSGSVGITMANAE